MWLSGVADSARRLLPTPLLVAHPSGAVSRFAEQMLVASDGLRGSDETRGVREPARRRWAIGAHAGSRTRLAFAPAQVSDRSTGTAHRARGPAGQSGRDRVWQRGPHDHRCCQRLGASLVVMSSRRRAGLSALGSVSRRVVRHGSCSVLLVPPERLLQDPLLHAPVERAGA